MTEAAAMGLTAEKLDEIVAALGPSASATMVEEGIALVEQGGGRILVIESDRSPGEIDAVVERYAGRRTGRDGMAVSIVEDDPSVGMMLSKKLCREREEQDGQWARDRFDPAPRNARRRR